MGIIRAAPLALSAFLASAASTLSLQSSILSSLNVDDDPWFQSYCGVWQTKFGCDLPVRSAWSSQSTWNSPQVLADKARVWQGHSDNFSLSRLTAVSSVHSGDWLHALPISSCGLRLSNEAIRIAVGLRLGLDLCLPHVCPCGGLTDAKGVHALSCRRSAGRLARHHAVNDIVHRALVRAQIPSSKEPSGLVRSDGKRPDGVTLIPWSQGKCLTWDVTIVNPMASSYVNSTALVPGGTAELAAERKMSKYSTLADRYIFQPLAFEAVGSLNSSALSFFIDLGRRLEETSGDCREREFLFQRLSVAIQRFNEVALHGSFVVEPFEDDC